jgi:hypothetical protein
MNLVGVAARAVLLPLDALGVQAAILRGEVVAIFTIVASEDDFISWHFITPLPAARFPLPTSLRVAGSG